MSSRFPDFVDPWRFADVEKQISGHIEITKLARLTGALKEPVGEAEFMLAFGRDAERRSRITGYVRAVLVLECQRCLGPMRYPVETSVDLIVVEGHGEAEQLPDSSDPLLIGETKVRLSDLVEDELLLALPQVAMHELEACTAKCPGREQPLNDGEQESATTPASPFAKLAELKTK